MNAAIIGYGSIGMRHARILRELKHRVAVVSSRFIDFPLVYSSIDQLFENERPDYIVIANKTSEHENTLRRIGQTGYSGIIVVEKPLFANLSSFYINPNRCYVGYNLRFHPILQRLREELKQAEVLSANIYVGQYLPQWRPQTDYRLGYSANKAEGGGVLRDLSHELDYANWLFGGWNKAAAIGGKLSDLEIDSDDHYSLLVRFRRCPNTVIQMNYLDHIGQRRIVVNTNHTTYMADFSRNLLQINDVTHQYRVERDDTYVSMHQALLSNDTTNACTFEQAIDTMKLIEAAEQANITGGWSDNA